MSKGVGEMVRSRSVQVKASGGTPVALRAPSVPADGAAGEAGPLAPGQRWSVGRKRDVVLRLLRGESLEALSRSLSTGTLTSRPRFVVNDTRTPGECVRGVSGNPVVGKLVPGSGTGRRWVCCAADDVDP